MLEKCGFILIGRDRGLANARGAEIEEVVLELRAGGRGGAAAPNQDELESAEPDLQSMFKKPGDDPAAHRRPRVTLHDETAE